MSFLTFLVLAVPFCGGLIACRLGGPLWGTLVGLLIFDPLFFGLLYVNALFPEWGPSPGMADAFAQAQQLIRGHALWWLPSYLVGAAAGYLLHRLTARFGEAAEPPAAGRE